MFQSYWRPMEFRPIRKNLISLYQSWAESLFTSSFLPDSLKLQLPPPLLLLLPVEPQHHPRVPSPSHLRKRKLLSTSVMCSAMMMRITNQLLDSEFYVVFISLSWSSIVIARSYKVVCSSQVSLSSFVSKSICYSSSTGKLISWSVSIGVLIDSSLVNLIVGILEVLEELGSLRHNVP